jgi:MscS family membrane protein
MFTTEFLGNTIGAYALSFLYIVGSVFIARGIYKIAYNFIESHTPKNSFLEILIKLLREPLLFALIILGIWYALTTLHFSPHGEKFISVTYYFLITFDIAWFIVRILDAVMERYVVPFADATETKLDDQLLPIVRKGLKVTVWILASLVALNNAGYDVGAIVASLGIGGLAFALAAKDTIANLFGSITIFLDEPFAIGDRITVNGYDGYVEEIGLRSTRLRQLNGRVVTLANSLLVNAPVENISSEPYRKVILVLGLVYDTTHEQMQRAITVLEEIARMNDLVEDDATASFIAFNSYSLDIEFIYYIKKSSCVFQAQSSMNLEILRRFAEEGLEFAFPTQTLLINKEEETT